MDKPIRMKSSKSNQAKPTNPTQPAQFACAVYFENGKQKLTYNLIGDYPKNQIIPGLLAVAQRVKATLLANIAPNDDNDRLLDILEGITEDAKASPEMEKVLQLDTLPTREAE